MDNLTFIGLFEKAGFHCDFVKKSKLGEGIVFNYMSRPFSFSNNGFEAEEITYMINVFLESSRVKKIEQIKNILINNGFYGVTVLPTDVDDTGMTNTPIRCIFAKAIEKE